VDISHDSKEKAKKKKEERKEKGVAVGDNLPRRLVRVYQKKRLVHQKKTMDPTLFNP
jgi:hypothetical protein